MADPAPQENDEETPEDPPQRRRPKALLRRTEPVETVKAAPKAKDRKLPKEEPPEESFGGWLGRVFSTDFI